MAGQVVILLAHVGVIWRKLTLSAATGSVLEFTEIIPKLMNPGESRYATILVARVSQNCIASICSCPSWFDDLTSIDIHGCIFLAVCRLPHAC